MPGGGEHRHVGADLGKDRLGGPLADPGDGGQLVPGPSQRAITSSTRRSRRRWRPPGAPGAQAPGVPAGRDGPRTGPVRLGAAGGACPQPPLGQLGQHPGIALPGDQRGEHRPTRGAQHVSGDRVELAASILQGLLDALALRGMGLDQPLAIASQLPQLAEGAGGTKPPRSSRAPTAPPARRRRRHRSCGRGGS
jgi:hypothetical protein